MGNVVNTAPEAGVHARPLDPDLNPWERQPGESVRAFRAFKSYRDSDDRKVTDHGGQSAARWSGQWSWGYRAYEFDRYMDRLDVEAMARYRRAMSERHRALARSGLGKMVQWLQTVDGSRLSPSEAVRLFETAVRVERLASGAQAPPGLPEESREGPEPPEPSLADLLDLSPEQEAALARQLHSMTGEFDRDK